MGSASEVSKDIGIDENGLFYKLLPRRTQCMDVSNALSHLRSAKRAFLEARCREGFTRYCIGQNPRQTQDSPQNKPWGITQNSSSTICLHVCHVYTLEISRQKAFIPSSRGCLFLGIRGQNRTTRKEKTHLCIFEGDSSHSTPPTSHVEHEKSLFLCFSPPLRAQPLSTANMVLLWRSGREEGSLSQFDGSKPAGVRKFFFVFENVATSIKSGEERASELLRYLEGDAFDFVYQAFVKNGDISAGGFDSQKFKKALVERFAPVESPEDVIRDAMAARLAFGDLSGPLRNSDSLYKKARFNDVAKFGLLRNAMMEHLELAQFAIYRGAKTYKDSFDAIMDFWSGCCAVQAAANSWSNSLYNELESSQGMYEPRGQVGLKKVMMRSNAPLYLLETNVDALTNHLADLSLMIKQHQSMDEATAFRPVHDHTCSYCKRPGHGANRCDANPHRDTKCLRCGKFGHSETSCWARVGPQREGSSAYSPMKIQAGAAALEKAAGSTGNQVSVVMHDELPADEKLVASVKRNADRECSINTPNGGGCMHSSTVDPYRRREATLANRTG